MKSSESITKLAEALAKAQGEIKTVVKDRTNPHFKNRYATLDAIVEAVRPVLSKHGLSVIQGASESVGTFQIETMLLHSSGEFITNIVPMTLKQTDAQGVGSGITYGRRYGISAILSLATDEDDDGEATKPKPVKTEAKPESKKETKPERVTAPEFDGSLEAAMTFKYEGKGEHHGKPLGEVPVEILGAARDVAAKSDAKKFADFIARADRVLAFHRGEN